MQRRPEDTHRLPTKDLTQTRRSALSWICTCKSWKKSFHFTATACNLCFNEFIFVEVSAIIFCSTNILLVCKGSYWGWVCHWARGWTRAEQSSFDFMQAACSMASKECFGFQGMQPRLIKVLMLGLLMELAWLYRVYHWRSGEATTETERSWDFDKETVADSFPLCGPFFESKNNFPQNKGLLTLLACTASL